MDPKYASLCLYLAFLVLLYPKSSLRLTIVYPARQRNLFRPNTHFPPALQYLIYVIPHIAFSRTTTRGCYPYPTSPPAPGAPTYLLLLLLQAPFYPFFLARKHHDRNSHGFSLVLQTVQQGSYPGTHLFQPAKSEETAIQTRSRTCLCTPKVQEASIQDQKTQSKGK